MSTPVSTEEITVLVQWRETCKYEKRVRMTRADFDTYQAAFGAGGRVSIRVQNALFQKFHLNSEQPHDWDDEEIETFEEVPRE